MKTIHKYVLNPGYENIITTKTGAKILSIQNQHEKICLWIEVNTDHWEDTREFIVYGTGDSINPNLLQKYIGTVQIAGGSLVWHIYEVV